MKKSLVTSDKALVIRFLTKLIKEFPAAVIVCDETIKKLYVEEFVSLLSKRPPLFCIPCGEAGKTRESKALIEDFLFENKITKDGLIIAIGGGSVLDVVGFTASTYLRGIQYVSLPTTLLAMVDACIGGKTAINTPYGKNTIGSFHSPLKTLTYIPFLHTLRASRMLDGAAEVIKYSLIKAPSVMDQLLEVWFDKAHERLFLLENLVSSCQKIKCDVVKNDPFDEGERQLLNFGHTIGHSIEVVSEFTITHGHAIAIGMAVEIFIAIEEGLVPRVLLKNVLAHLSLLGFDLNLLQTKPLKEYLDVMRLDKKNREGEIRFVLLRKWGRCHIDEDNFTHGIDIEVIKKALTWMQVTFAKPTISQGV